jgi:hypothetical protein
MATEDSPKTNVSTETSNVNPTPESSQSSNAPLPLPEPPKNTDSTTLDVSSGQSVKLDHLGPLVVNRDGTLSRIANWEQMSEIERRNTVRILGKRNQLRRDALQSEEENGKN